MLEKMKFSRQEDGGEISNDEDLEPELFENPKRALADLKSLFDNNKIAFNRSDEMRVLTAIYTQDKPVIRLYRELLFRRIAQRAI